MNKTTRHLLGFGVIEAISFDLHSTRPRPMFR